MSFGLETDFVDEKIFNAFSEVRPDESEVTQHNYCPDCKIPMTLAGNEYQCNQCGQMQQYIVDAVKDTDEIVNSSIRISTGSNKGRFYNITGDYTKTQKKIVLDQLLRNQSNFKGNAFPINILNAAATLYNNIQKLITEDDVDENGNVKGQKKFVRRGYIKDEVLAAIIYFECIREKLVRKKRDIALFMKLPNNGFSRGEDILRNLHAEGKIDIPCDGDEPIIGYVDRYLEALNLDDPIWSNFIIDLVTVSENKKIGMNSQLSSKVVAAVWILNIQCGLNKSPQIIEKACDNTKKNTFTKFTKIVSANLHIFKDVFDRHGISTLGF